MRPLLFLLTFVTCLHAAPNILFIVADDQRPDTIHALGNGVIDTPNLDRLVARGTTFTRAYAGYPICHVSRAQILTGNLAFKALPKYPGGAIDPSLATLGGTLQKAGYHTCYSGKWHNDGHPKQRGYTTTSGLYSSGGGKSVTQPDIDDRGRPLTGYRGWTFKDDNNQAELGKGVGLQPDNSRHIADGAIHAIQAAPVGKPLFLHVNFAFPHDPRQWPAGMKDRYAASKMPLPSNFAPQHPFDHGNISGRDELLLPTPRIRSEVREELAIYYAMITDLDAQLGRILDALPAPDDTIIIFTSDQGLALGSHGLLGKQNEYEHSIRSPLIICGPGLPKNERSAALANLNDLFPTLCELTGIAVPPTVQSKSLAPLLRHQADRVHDFVTGVFTDTQRMICDERWKLVLYPKAGREQLFDLQSDPNELHDLSADPAHQATKSEMAARLLSWRRKNGDPDL
ncbi:MAG: sulfatase-like hydrolase/transferase [Prosthecobacter sp.]|uniref:sulfatase-like hydrolase/transferase n=1 Tax=Prosthecobacter sp. TaxID=1965333 RepID=UPI0025DF496A|nr:sulfatase-like hydrolase/transferase [Prosthecobacter sp.]MCF7785393.1 sulfatase-like hydrolase/transferase [Prosthecobacter sp.]